MMNGAALIARLPKVRGKLQAEISLADLTWLRTGGPAEVLFSPADVDDLAEFLQNKPEDVPITIIGVGSNLLVRDGGVEGVVIRLGRAFAEMEVLPEQQILAGAAVLDVRLARFAADHSIDGLRFYRGIPGSIGGALRMNGGAYGSETADVLVEAYGVNMRGEKLTFRKQDMGYSYRHCSVPEDVIFTSALFQGRPGNRDEILAAMEEITAKREATQPVKSRTGGSTFKNPPGHKSWQLIDEAGLRGFRVGGAHMSELHCNFLINDGEATAADIETLGESVREKVKKKSGVDLEWEIRRIGIAGKVQS